MSAMTKFAPVGDVPGTSGDARKFRKRRGGSGPHPVDVHAGSRLRQRRTLLGMSQGTLGERVGLTFQQIQKYERGTNRMGASRLYELAAVLDIPVSYFFDEFVAREASGLPSTEIGKHELRLLSAYLGIGDADVRKSLYDLVRTVGGKTPAHKPPAGKTV